MIEITVENMTMTLVAPGAPDLPADYSAYEKH
jgi:hypothetical protein